MTYVITEACIDVKDQSCIEVCPVDCIYSDDEDRICYVEPDACIDCGVCEPECPWEAIFEDEDVPELFQTDIALNAKVIDLKDDFRLPDVVQREPPSPKEVEANKQKWGLSA